MKILFLSTLLMGNFFLFTPLASCSSMEELEHKILTIHNEVTNLISVAFSAVSCPLTFHERQDNLLIAQETLSNLLNDYTTLAGKQFSLPNTSSPIDPILSAQLKEELEHQILTTYKDLTILLVSTPSISDPSMFNAHQENISTTQAALSDLLNEYFTLTRERFILPNTLPHEDSILSETSIILSLDDSTSYASSTDTFPSEQSLKELELTHEILTIYNDVIKLAAIRKPLNADPSKFKEGQEDLSIAQSILASLLEDYFTLTGEYFNLPEIASSESSPTTSTESQSTEESTSDTHPVDIFQINTPVYYNGFMATYAGRNKGKTSQESFLKEAQKNSLLPVRFVNPNDNLHQLELVRFNKTSRNAPANTNTLITPQ